MSEFFKLEPWERNSIDGVTPEKLRRFIQSVMHDTLRLNKFVGYGIIEDTLVLVSYVAGTWVVWVAEVTKVGELLDEAEMPEIIPIRFESMPEDYDDEFDPFDPNIGA